MRFVLLARISVVRKDLRAARIVPVEEMTSRDIRPRERSCGTRMKAAHPRRREPRFGGMGDSRGDGGKSPRRTAPLSLLLPSHPTISLSSLSRNLARAFSDEGNTRDLIPSLAREREKEPAIMGAKSRELRILFRGHRTTDTFYPSHPLLPLPLLCVFEKQLPPPA